MLDLLKIRRRRAFFDDYGSRPAEQTAKLPPRGVRFSCPCCGYPTLAGRGTDEICEICWWEDDGQDDDQADEVAGGPNAGYSLNDARENFQQYLVMFPPEKDRRIGGPDSEAALGLKVKLIQAFESMMGEPAPEQMNSLWEQVRAMERALNAELKTRMRSTSGHPE